MKATHSLLAIAALLALVMRCGPGIGPPSDTCSVSSSWTTADDWVPYPGAASTIISSGLAVNSSGNVFVSAYANGGGLPRFTSQVRKGTDGGTNWSVVDTFTYGSNNGAQLFSVWTDGAQTVFVQGGGFDASANRHWLIRRSDDEGTTWTTADDYQLDSAYESLPGFNNTAVVELSNGTWLLQGQGADAASSQLLVRKSTDRGTTWSTLYNYQYQAGYNTSSRSIARDSSGVLYLGAHGMDSAGTTHWLVLKSSDNGVSWTVMDDYVHAVGQVSGIKGILAISGTLIVTGTAANSSGTNHWLTRRSTDGGASWTTVDLLSDSVAQADPVQDDRGYIYIGGANGLAPNRTPTIRRSTDQGVTWATVDTLPTNTYGISAFRAITRAPDGSLYALAQSVESTSVNHVVVRKLACN